MRRHLAILTVAGLLLASCSNRERANPFDPLNPNSSGRPPGFVALAGDRVVTLSWQRVHGTTLIGFQLYRRAPGETDFSPLTGVLDPDLISLRDFAVVNGADYQYQLYFVFVSGLGNLPAEDTATPGAAAPWLIENGGVDLIRVTADARHVVERRGGFLGTADVAANPANGDVWVCETNLGRVGIFIPINAVTVTISGLAFPRAVAVDPFDGSGWVCDESRGRVYSFQRNGSPGQIPMIGPFTRPVDVAVDPNDGSVWVADLGADRVSRYLGDQPQWNVPVVDPSRVAVDSTTREGWVTSYATGTLTHLSVSGQSLGTVTGLVSPLGVAVDPRRGRIWVADPGAGQVVAVRRDRTVEFRVGGLTDVGELSVDVGTGEVWAVQQLGGALVRIAPGGTVIRVLPGFRSPFAVSVDPGGR